VCGGATYAIADIDWTEMWRDRLDELVAKLSALGQRIKHFNRYFVQPAGQTRK
jgi:hypothetical protein